MNEKRSFRIEWEEAEIGILGLLVFLNCSDTFEWPETEFCLSNDIFCFKSTNMSAITRYQYGHHQVGGICPSLEQWR